MKTIIFDLGGVLIDWNPHALYAPYFNSSAEIDQFLQEIGFAAWNAQQDAGRPFAEGVALLSAEFPHRATLIQAYHLEWENAIPGPIDGTVQILRQLKENGHSLCALTNFSTETFPIMRRRYDFLTWFEYILVSGEVGLIKPNPAIYALLLQKINQPAHNCLFIDDSAVNIAAAHQLGFDTLQFQSPALLKTELQQRGLL
jgi:2-haloacid dehalogenase